MNSTATNVWFDRPAHSRVEKHGREIILIVGDLKFENTNWSKCDQLITAKISLWKNFRKLFPTSNNY